MKFAIIIPCRNSEMTIAQCLTGLSLELEPVNLPHEVIVVLDRCDDSTEEIVKDFPVKIVKADGKGRSCARNTGAKQTNAEFIIFLDSDCIVQPGFIKSLLREMNSANVDWIQASVVPVSSEPNNWNFIQLAKTYGFITDGTYNMFEKINFLELPTGDSAACCVRSAAFKRLGMFDPRLVRFEDRDLCGRFFLSKSVLKSCVDAKVFKIVQPISRKQLFVKIYQTNFGRFRSSCYFSARFSRTLVDRFKNHFRSLVRNNLSNEIPITFRLIQSFLQLSFIFLSWWKLLEWSTPERIVKNLRKIGVMYQLGQKDQFGILINSKGQHQWNPFQNVE